MIGDGFDSGESGCSRADCEASAEWNVNWRNPKIHTPDRVKVWLACSDHVDYLREFLAARNFPVIVTPFGQSVGAVPDAGAAER